MEGEGVVAQDPSTKRWHLKIGSEEPERT
jgi:hypothetical protein